MTREIPLTQGQVALIDDADFDLVSQWKWYANLNQVTWYARRWLIVDGRRVNVSLHRFLLDAKPGTIVDHVDGNGLNCQRHNMRFVTWRQNNTNRRRVITSRQFKGICLKKKTGKWVAQISVDNKGIHGGYFTCMEDAARAYDDLARKHHGEFGRFNFPRDGEQAA